MNPPLLTLRNVRFAYPDGTPALGGISLDLREGETVGVVGANGAGKSTLLLLLAGVLAPSTGAIGLDGASLKPASLPLLRQRLGLVFQNPDDQLFMATVGEDVAFGPRNLGLTETEVEARVEEALRLVDMANRRDRTPSRLSGGEKRAAALATILAMRPDILLLDEPTAFLDPKARRQLMKRLANFGHTKIMTSHDLDMVMEICERVVVLKGGALAADGPSREVLADAGLLESCGLELPLSLQGCPRCGKRYARREM